MINAALAVLLLIVLLFGVIVYFGAPYVPTKREQRKQALDLLDLEPGDLMVDMGSGDGSLLIDAAQRGFRGVGYEINPLLVIISRYRIRKYADQIEIRHGNFWIASLPKDMKGMYVFAASRYMKRLHVKLIADTHDQVTVVSYAFKLPDDKKLLREANPFYVYKYGPVAKRTANS